MLEIMSDCLSRLLLTIREPNDRRLLSPKLHFKSPFATWLIHRLGWKRAKNYASALDHFTHILHPLLHTAKTASEGH
ncbi:hypothetical protein HUJ05_006342 [Dendroctonus ponderosae]|nr:hypothetical protein HUJ05_006342 [Dendroctonus ponderosae]